MSTPAPPPPGAPLDPLNVQQGAQAATQPPSIKRSLLGLIPIAGPLLMAHARNEYLQDFAKNEQAIGVKNQHRSFVNSIVNSTLSPEIRENARQLQLDLTHFDTEKGAWAKPYSPDIQKRLEGLYGQAGPGLALQSSQAQSNIPPPLQQPIAPMAQNNYPAGLQWNIANQPPMANQPPPPMTDTPGLPPQGSGGARVPESDLQPVFSPQAHMRIATQYPDIAPYLNDPTLAPVLPRLFSGNAENESGAVADIRGLISARVRQQAQIENLKSIYGPAAWDKFTALEKSQLIDKGLMTQEPDLPPGAARQLAGTGGITMYNPAAVTTAEGATSNIPTGPTFRDAQGNLVDAQGQPLPVSAPPPPGSPAAQAGTPGAPGYTTVKSPAKLNPEETRRVNAARAVANKHKDELKRAGIVFDPTKDPRNPSAQLPPELIPEFEAEDARLREDPEVREARLAQLNISKQNQQTLLALRNLQEQTTQQKITEWNATHSPQAIKGITDTVLASGGETFHELQPDVKALVTRELQSRGIPSPPRKLGQQELDSEGNAQLALLNINSAREMLQNPVIAKNVGVIAGNLGDLEQRFGTTIRGLTAKDEEDIQKFRTALNYLYFQEGKTIFQGRMPQNLMKEFAKTSARTNMDLPMLRGALGGAEQFANQRINNTNSRRWGGQVPAAVRGAQSAPTAPPPPPPPPSDVPANVKKVLSPASVSPGIHKLSDGSSWMKAQDGTISPAPAR